MQRIQLLSTPYSFRTTWTGAILFAVRAPHGDGWNVHFPQAIGTHEDSEGGAKKVWFHCARRVKLLPNIPYAEKERYTLVPSRIKQGEQVWAKILPIQRTNALDCAGCAFDEDDVNCKKAQPCSQVTRWDKRDVIFITAVELW